ncbi:MAG: DUF177 domain-containing protein [Methylovirgula sp.]
MTAKPMRGAAAPSKIFSYPINVTDVPDSGLDIRIAADAATLRALAAADDLPSIASLEAEFHVAPKAGHRFNVSGEMRAKVTQICVVSLEPFDSEIVEPIDVDFAPPMEAKAAAAAAAGITLPDGAAAMVAQEREPPDPIIDGKLDLGALASEFLALGLDPYPRKPGVAFEPPGGQDEDKADTPFSVLRKLKERS